MKQFIYPPETIGLDAWPSGELRLDGIEVTADPDEADLFVVPIALLHLQNPADLDRFPYMEGREERHVLFDVSDWQTVYNRKNCILLRCNLTRSLLAAHPNSLCIAWPVEDFAECVELPDGGKFLFDISFQGWLSSPARIDSSNACKNNPELECDIAQYQDFSGYLHDRTTGEWSFEGIRRRTEFRRSMKESRIALCPESIPGHFPYRFFEAMSAGRMPLLVSSDYVFPFEDIIPWSDFCLFCERDNAGKADQVALNWVRTYGDEETLRRGRLARHYWEKYLDSRKWSSLFSFAVKRKLRELGLTTEEAVLA